MREHAGDPGIPGAGREIPLVESPAPGRRSQRPDLVVDLSGFQELSVADLALLLTAQRHIQEEDGSVWLAGVPHHVWEALNAMGLGPFFRPFPFLGRGRS